jgi:hypothetical protein
MLIFGCFRGRGSLEVRDDRRTRRRSELGAIFLWPI